MVDFSPEFNRPRIPESLEEAQARVKTSLDDAVVRHGDEIQKATLESNARMPFRAGDASDKSLFGFSELTGRGWNEFWRIDEISTGIESVNREVFNLLNNPDTLNRIGHKLDQNTDRHSRVDSILWDQTALDTAAAILNRREQMQTGAREAEKISLTSLRILRDVGNAIITRQQEIVSRESERNRSRVTAVDFLVAWRPQSRTSAREENLRSKIENARQEFEASIDALEVTKKAEVGRIGNRIAEMYRESANRGNETSDSVDQVFSAEDITGFLHTIAQHPTLFINGALTPTHFPGGRGFLLYQNNAEGRTWRDYFGVGGTILDTDLLQAVRDEGFRKVDSKHADTSYLESYTTQRETQYLSEEYQEKVTRQRDRYDEFNDLAADPTTHNYFSELQGLLERGPGAVDPYKKAVKLSTVVHAFERNLRRSPLTINQIYGQNQARGHRGLMLEERIIKIAQFLTRHPGQVQQLLPAETRSMIVRYLRDEYSKGAEHSNQGTLNEGGELGNLRHFEHCRNTLSAASIINRTLESPLFLSEIQNPSSALMSDFFAQIRQLINDYEVFCIGRTPEQEAAGRGERDQRSFMYAVEQGLLQEDEQNRLFEYWRVAQQIYQAVTKTTRVPQRDGEPRDISLFEQWQTVADRMQKQVERQAVTLRIQSIAAAGGFNTGQQEALQAEADRLDREIQRDGGDINDNNIPRAVFNLPSQIAGVPFRTGANFNTTWLDTEIGRRSLLAGASLDMNQIMYDQLSQGFTSGIRKVHQRERRHHMVDLNTRFRRVPVGEKMSIDFQVVRDVDGKDKDRVGPDIANVDRDSVHNFTVLHKNGAQVFLKGKMALPPVGGGDDQREWTETDVIIILGQPLPGKHPTAGHAGKGAIVRSETLADEQGNFDPTRFKSTQAVDRYILLSDAVTGHREERPFPPGIIPQEDAGEHQMQEAPGDDQDGLGGLQGPTDEEARKKAQQEREIPESQRRLLAALKDEDDHQTYTKKLKAQQEQAQKMQDDKLNQGSQEAEEPSDTESESFDPKNPAALIQALAEKQHEAEIQSYLREATHREAFLTGWREFMKQAEGQERIRGIRALYQAFALYQGDFFQDIDQAINTRWIIEALPINDDDQACADGCIDCLVLMIERDMYDQGGVQITDDDLRARIFARIGVRRGSDTKAKELFGVEDESEKQSKKEGPDQESSRTTHSGGQPFGFESEDHFRRSVQSVLGQSLNITVNTQVNPDFRQEFNPQIHNSPQVTAELVNSVKSGVLGNLPASSNGETPPEDPNGDDDPDGPGDGDGPEEPDEEAESPELLELKEFFDAFLAQNYSGVEQWMRTKDPKGESEPTNEEKLKKALKGAPVKTGSEARKIQVETEDTARAYFFKELVAQKLQGDPDTQEEWAQIITKLVRQKILIANSFKRESLDARLYVTRHMPKTIEGIEALISLYEGDSPVMRASRDDIQKAITNYAEGIIALPNYTYLYQDLLRLKNVVDIKGFELIAPEPTE